MYNTRNGCMCSKNTQNSVYVNQDKSKNNLIMIVEFLLFDYLSSYIPTVIMHANY